MAANRAVRPPLAGNPTVALAGTQAHRPSALGSISRPVRRPSRTGRGNVEWS